MCREIYIKQVLLIGARMVVDFHQLRMNDWVMTVIVSYCSCGRWSYGHVKGCCHFNLSQVKLCHASSHHIVAGFYHQNVFKTSLVLLH